MNITFILGNIAVLCMMVGLAQLFFKEEQVENKVLNATRSQAWFVLAAAILLLGIMGK